MSGEICVEKVGDGVLATFSTGATVWFESAEDAVNFATAVLQVVAWGTENGVLDEMDARGVFGHEGPRE